LPQDLTSSRPLRQKALDQLELAGYQRPQLNRSGGGYPGGGGGAPAPRCTTPSILLPYLNDAIASARKADTLVYSIPFADPRDYRQQPQGGFGGRGVRRGGMCRMPREKSVAADIREEGLVSDSAPSGSRRSRRD
jgi:hypothetical protein